MNNQSQEKKEEGMKGLVVDVSQVFSLVVQENPIYNTIRFVLQGSGKIVEGICTRIDGCKVVSGTCPTCVIDKVWE